MNTHAPNVVAVKRRMFGLARIVYVARCACGLRGEGTTDEQARAAIGARHREVAR